MEKYYTTKKKTIIDALNDVEAFLTRLEEVREELDYSYNIQINPIPSGEFKWELVLKLMRDETTEN